MSAADYLSILPLWRQALHNLLEQNPGPGSIIKKDWLMVEFGIPSPVTAQEQREAELDFLKQFVEFRRELLEVYQIELLAIPGTGYEVVHPRDQTKLALRIRTRNIGKELRHMLRSVANVRLGELNDGERREQADGMAKAASLASMFNRRNLMGRE